MDNGPEFISTALAEWTEAHIIELEFIQPGKSTQNSYVERSNRTYRDEILNMYVFRTLGEVRELTENWLSGSGREGMVFLQTGSSESGKVGCINFAKQSVAGRKRLT